uniref:Uncharacterized protein n=1 Tax=Anopheles farauti TaxID=69004 RepID=A0A182R174_9DIPT
MYATWNAWPMLCAMNCASSLSNTWQIIFGVRLPFGPVVLAPPLSFWEGVLPPPPVPPCPLTVCPVEPLLPAPPDESVESTSCGTKRRRAISTTRSPMSAMSVFSTMIFSVEMNRSTSVLGCTSPSGDCRMKTQTLRDFDLVEPPGLPESFDLSSRLASLSECCGLGFGDVSCVCGSFGPLKLMRLPLAVLTPVLWQLVVAAPTPPFTVLLPALGPAPVVPRSGTFPPARLELLPTVVLVDAGRKLPPPVAPFDCPVRDPTAPVPNRPSPRAPWPVEGFAFATTLPAPTLPAPTPEPAGTAAFDCSAPPLPCCFGDTLPSAKTLVVQALVAEQTVGFEIRVRVLVLVDERHRRLRRWTLPDQHSPGEPAAIAAAAVDFGATSCSEDGDDDSLQDGPATVACCSPFVSVPVPAPPLASALLPNSSFARVRGIQIGERLGAPPLLVVPPVATPPPPPPPPSASLNSPEHIQLSDSPVPVGAPDVALITPLLRSSHMVAPPLPVMSPKSLPYWGEISLS